MKLRTKIIAVAITAVLAVGGAVTGITVHFIKNKPENVAISAAANTMEQLLERKEIAPIYDMINGGSLKFNVSDIKDEYGNIVLGKDAISGKLYFNTKAFMLDDLIINTDELDLNASFYLSNKLIYVKDNKYLNGAYGIKLEELADDIEDSIFAYSANSKYSLSEMMSLDEYDDFLDMLEAYDSEDIERLKEDAEKLFESLIKEFWEIVVDNVTITEETRNVRLGNDRSEARVITIQITAEELYDIICDAYEQILVDGTKVDKFLKKHEDTLNLLIGNTKNQTVMDIYDGFLDTIDDNIKQIRNRIEMQFEDLVIEVVTPKRKATLLKLAVDIDGEEIFELNLGPKGIKSTDYISLSVFGEEQIKYTVVEDSKEKFESNLTVQGEEVLEFEYNRSRKEFDLSIGEYEFSGTLKIERGVYSFALKSISETYYILRYDEEYTDTMLCDISLVIDRTDKMPSAPKKYTSLPDLTEKIIDGWISEFE